MRLVFAVVFALLLAQFGAIAHGYSHDSTVASAASHQTGAANHQSCDDCIAYAAVLSAAGASAHFMPLVSAQSDIALSLGLNSLHDDLLLLAFRSRAPPDAR